MNKLALPADEQAIIIRTLNELVASVEAAVIHGDAEATRQHLHQLARVCEQFMEVFDEVRFSQATVGSPGI